MLGCWVSHLHRFYLNSFTLAFNQLPNIFVLVREGFKSTLFLWIQPQVAGAESSSACRFPLLLSPVRAGLLTSNLFLLSCSSKMPVHTALLPSQDLSNIQLNKWRKVLKTAEDSSVSRTRCVPHLDPSVLLFPGFSVLFCCHFSFFFQRSLEHTIYFSKLVGEIPRKLFLNSCLLSLSRSSLPFLVYI